MQSVCHSILFFHGSLDSVLLMVSYDRVNYYSDLTCRRLVEAYCIGGSFDFCMLLCRKFGLFDSTGQVWVGLNLRSERSSKVSGIYTPKKMPDPLTSGNGGH